MRGIHKHLAGGLLALALALSSTLAWALKCDVDNNGRIDRNDLALIQQATLARTPVSGPDDPRDADNNGVINSADSRICTLRCKYASCASNGAPVADAGPAQTVRVTDTVTLNAAASSDPDGDPLRYSWAFTSRPAGSGASLGGANTVNPTFVADKPGSYVVQLVVNDGSVNSAPASVTISTRNSAPVADAGPDQTAPVGASVVLDARRSSDVDGDALSYAWRLVSAPAGSAAALSSASAVQPTFSIDVAGSYEFELIVRDASLASAPDRVIVSTLNSPPVARPGANRSVALGALVPLDGSASSDVDGDPLSYAWSLLSRPAGSGAALANPTAVNPSFTADRPGSYVVQLIVNDGRVNSAAASVIISTDNSPPVARAGADQTVPLGAQVQLDGSTSSDAEGAALAYAWSLITRPAGSTATLTAPNSVNPRFVADQPGSYVAQLIVSDASLASAPATVLITATTPNQAPVAVASANPAAVVVGASVSLSSAGSSDPDGNPITFSWTLAARPGGSNASIATPGAASATLVPDVPGIYTVQLTVSDGSLSATALATVTASAANRAPVITSTPVTQAGVNTAYAYDVDATDPDAGDVLTYSLTTAPGGMSINPASGLIQWVPAAGQVGSNNVTVRVRDPGGLFATQSFVVLVVAAQLPVTVPNVVSLDEAAARAAVTGAGLSVGNVSVASSNTMPAGRVISQSPAAGAAVVAGSAVALVVSSGPVAPTLASIVVTPANLLLLAGQGQAYAATGVFSDGTSQLLTSSVTWASSNPAIAAINGAGVASALADGGTSIRATLGAVTGSTGLTVRAAVGDATPPVASISAPANGATLTTSVAITGTASDANFLKYVLEIATVGSSSFSTLAVGTAPVSNGTLGTLDPGLLINDLYTIRLTVFDRGGNQTSSAIGVQVTRDEKVGKFTLAFEDLAIPLAGIPIAIDRVYDSREKSSGDFGVGWRLDLQTLRLRANRQQGSAWTVTRTGGLFPTYTLVPSEPHKISITLPDGKVEEFDMTVTPSSSVLLPLEFATASYTPRSGTLGTLRPLGGDGLYVSGAQPGVVELLDDGDFFTVYDPQSFLYTSPSGRQFVLDRSAGLRSVTDQNGNSLTISAAGITHSSGKSVAFARDVQGRITQITDPKGSVIRYAYDANGDLASHTDALGNVTRYFYNLSHGLIEVRDPLGRRGIRNEYDDQGRLVAVIDAKGNRQQYTHNTGIRQEIITDRLGNTSVLNYDDKGNVTSETNPLGGTILRTYNASGRKLTETDPLGQTTTFTYDANDNLLSRTDALGNVTSSTYNAQGQVLTSTDARGQVTSYTYDSRGNQLTARDPLGNVITSGYDAGGNRVSSTDATGAVLNYVYDAGGNRTRYTDAGGTVTNYTYDANGKTTAETSSRTTATGVVSQTIGYTYDAGNRLIATTDALGFTTRTDYDAAGKVAASVDKLGRRIDNTYDEVGRLIQRRHADGATESFAYDAEGNLVSVTDPLGRITSYAYDALKRLIRTVYADGSVSSRSFDAAGRLSSETDENGNVSSHGYDAAGRRIRSTDALGNATLYTYDANGNQTSLTDANGRSTQYQYDANNRRVRTTFPDSTFASVSYDAAGRKTADTDPSGRSTSYQYDALGRLVRVTDALGQATLYGYDEAGNKLTQTDAAGRVTRWQYDALGRVTRLTRPLGMAESFSYDANGNLLTHTDFNGATTQYTYDGSTRGGNRLLTTRYPDGSVVSATYTAAGQQASVTDSAGTVSHLYDQRDRLLQSTRPDGSTLAYSYDARGNRLSVVVASGTTRYTYDALNRLASVTDADGGINRYAYDNVGNRVSALQANGTRSDYGYDASNRLLSVAHRGPALNLLSSHTYTLGASGQRLAVAELGGRSVGYSYDALYRLVGEAVTDPVAGNVTQAYGYDSVGNRVSRTFNGVPTALTYDANNRLLQDGGTSYSYDNNGNTLTRTVGGATTTLAYDAENRLVSESGAGGAHAYAYDADGLRRSATHGGVLTRYLVDKNRDLAQVLEERDGAGALVASYAWGAELLSQRQAGLRSHYHRDAVGSTRLLTNGLGAVTDTDTYDAWGNPLGATGSTPHNHRFAGEQRDASSGRYYLRARYYLPDAGRFLTSDPIEGVASEPLSLHKYLYANGDPVNRSDPTGLFSAGEVGVSLNISATLGSISLSTLRLALLLRNIGIAVGQTLVAACASGSLISAVTAVGSGNPCDVTKYNVFYPGLDTPVTTAHIATAQSFGFKANLHRRAPPVRGARYFPGSPCGASAVGGMACDEYPFASADEGFPLPISLMLTPSGESSRQGGLLAAFYGACKVIPNDPWEGAFGVVPTSLPVTAWVCK